MPEQVIVNVPTTLVIAVDTVTVCDCGPEVSVPVTDPIGNTVIVPEIVAAGAHEDTFGLLFALFPEVVMV